MNKIFEGAKFGDKFKTRDGRMAIFHSRDEYANICIVRNTTGFWSYTDFGECLTPSLKGFDIASKWDESIDKEKLDRLAEESFYKGFHGSSLAKEYKNGFAAGYRKAKEEV